jgi:hypothetical protein
MAMFGSALPLGRPGAMDSRLVNALKTVVLPDLGKPNSPIFILPSPQKNEPSPREQGWLIMVIPQGNSPRSSDHRGLQRPGTVNKK